jgi:transposase
MSVEKPKPKILKQARAWNPHPERVKADLFKSHPFFDPEDKVQVKYEMLRAREVDGDGLSETCSKFGFSRESYRHILDRFRLEGIAGLFGHKPGRKGPVKATEGVAEFIHGERSRDGSLSADELASRCGEECGVSLSRRTVFRILAATPESKKKQP